MRPKIKNYRFYTPFLVFLFVFPVHAEEAVKDLVEGAFYECSELQSEIKNTGLTRKYYPNGVVKAETMCLDGKREGAQKEFYPNGFLKKIAMYKNDLLEGSLIKYTEEGRFSFEWKFLDGEMVKNYVRQYEYHENGNIKFEYFYSGNEGFRNEFYESGQISSRLLIKFGREFIRIKYDREGNLLSKELVD